MNSALKGRMNRATYFATLGLIVVLLVAISIFASKPPAVLEVLLVWIGVPRLHDIGRSGWWILVLFTFEIGGIVAGFMSVPRADIEIVGGLIVFVMLIAMIVLGCIKGDPGVNDFGDPPLGLFGRGARKAE
jgi:uncharacterized membrane protein YhaH (DUF805 family)